MALRFSRLIAFSERWLTWLLVLTLALALAILVAHLYKPDYVWNVVNKGIVPEQGHAFLVRLPQPSPLHQLRSDVYAASKLSIREDGKILAPAQSPHATIRANGRGAFSHWYGYLYFSTSDNSDPRENGRDYVVEAPVAVDIKLYLLLAISLAASLTALHLLWRSESSHPATTLLRRALDHPRVQAVTRWIDASDRRRRKLERATNAVIILALIIGINQLFLNATGMRACLSPDSAGYLTFTLLRSPFYPAIVQTTHTLTNDIRWLIPLQLNAILLSLAVLGTVIGRLCNSRLWGLAFTLLSFTLTPVLLLSYMILTEALFAAFITLHIAMAGMFLATRSWCYAILAGVFLAGIILMRPAGYSMLLAVPLLIWLLRGEPLKALVGVGSPVAICFLAVSTFNFAKHGTFDAQSFGGLTLLGHVAHLIRPGDGAHTEPHGETVERIAAKIAPIAAGLRSQPFPREYWKQKSLNYNKLLNSIITIIVNDVQDAPIPNAGLVIDKTTIQTSMAIALATMRAYPCEYVRNAIANYYGMWQGLLLDYGTISGHANMCYKNMSKMTSSERSPFATVTDLSYLDHADTALRYRERAGTTNVLRYAWVQTTTYGDLLRSTAFALSIVFVLLSLRAIQDSLLLLLSYASFQLNAYFGYMGAITSAIERYSVPFTPVLLLLLFGALVLLVRLSVHRLIPRTVTPVIL